MFLKKFNKKELNGRLVQRCENLQRQMEEMTKTRIEKLQSDLLISKMTTKQNEDELIKLQSVSATLRGEKLQMKGSYF